MADRHEEGVPRERPAGRGALDELVRLPQGVFALSRDWRYAFVNEAAERLVGREPGTLAGKVIWEEFPTAVGSPFDLAYRRAMDSQEVVQVTEHFEPLDRWYEVTVTPHGDLGITVVFDDVTSSHTAKVLVAMYGPELLRGGGRGTAGGAGSG